MDIFDETKQVSDLFPEDNIVLRIAKLTEELGELSTATLQLIYYKPRKGLEGYEIVANQVEEAIDVLMVAYDIIHKLGISKGQLQSVLDKKLTKWQNAIQSGQIHSYSLTPVARPKPFAPFYSDTFISPSMPQQPNWDILELAANNYPDEVFEPIISETDDPLADYLAHPTIESELVNPESKCPHCGKEWLRLIGYCTHCKHQRT